MNIMMWSWTVFLPVFLSLTVQVDFTSGQSLRQNFLDVVGLRGARCKPNGEHCRFIVQCCSGYCIGFTCQETCLGEGWYCTHDSDCCNCNCDGYSCLPCKEAGSWCLMNCACCSNECTWAFHCT